MLSFCIIYYCFFLVFETSDEAAEANRLAQAFVDGNSVLKGEISLVDNGALKTSGGHIIFDFEAPCNYQG